MRGENELQIWNQRNKFHIGLSRNTQERNSSGVPDQNAYALYVRIQCIQFWSGTPVLLSYGIFSMHPYMQFIAVIPNLRSVFSLHVPFLI